jgi:PTS system fructose-specific IIC component
MSNRFWVLIESTNAEIKAQIAEQSLKSEAEKSGAAVYVEIRDAAGVRSTFEGTPSSGDVLIVLGSAEPSVAFAGLPRTNATLDEALKDPAALLQKALKKAIPNFAAETAAGKPEAGALIVGVTSCPTGIAHTFMAAEGLEKAAAELGYRIRVETQGSVGAGNPLTEEEIAAASIVIISADREVDRSRFAGKKVFSSGTNAAITNGKALIEKAFVEATIQPSLSSSNIQNSQDTKKRTGPYKHLMTGVSFMLPFVVAGGLCVALAFAIGGINTEGVLAQFFMTLGSSGGFALMVPILAGYIAFSIADRPGIAPGMIGGLLCNQMNTGFLGGIAAGFIAGYLGLFLNKYIRLGKNFSGLKPVLILPLLGTSITGFIMYFVIGKPLGALNSFLVEWLAGMGSANSISLGLLLGGMMAVDMGGPVNKAAYAFSTGMLGSGIYLPIAAVMAAGMTPPIAAGLASLIFKKRFTDDEQESAWANIILGFSFITEGAIPFAAKDPLRALPAFIAGSALAGAVSMGLGIKLMAPHGGIFVLAIPGAISNLAGYLAAIAAGTLLSLVLLGILRKKNRII